MSRKQQGGVGMSKAGGVEQIRAKRRAERSRKERNQGGAEWGGVEGGASTLPKKTAYYMPYYMVYSYSMANSMANSLFNPNSLKTSQTVWQTETCLPNC